MMFDFAILLDILFLLVAIYLFPGIPPHHHGAHGRASTPNTPLPRANGHNDTPLPSPLPNLLAPSLQAPRIVLHPSHASSTAIPAAVSLTPRPNHKRKSVSFSISSMNDLLVAAPLSKGEMRQHRPPTPWMKGPPSPSELAGLLAGDASPMPSPFPIRGQTSGERTANFAGEGSLGVMVREPSLLDDAGEDVPLLSPKICSRDVVDAMGIKKSWLM